MANPDDSAVTFSVADEDHTLGNAVRYMLNQDPRVTFCGYTVPHPSDSRVNIRVQTTGEPAKEVFKDALKGVMEMCSHINQVFVTKVAEFKGNEGQEGAKMEVDGGDAEMAAEEDDASEEDDEE